MTEPLNRQELVTRPWFQGEECSGFSDLLRWYEGDHETFAAAMRGWLNAHHEFGVALRATQPERIQDHDGDLLARLREGAAGSWRPLEAAVIQQASRCALVGVNIRSWHDAAEVFRQKVVPGLIRSHGLEPGRLERALFSMQRLIDRALAAIAQEYLNTKERLLSEQRRQTDQALLRFSRLSESGVLGILVCDLVGNIREANDSFLSLVGYSRDEVLSGQVRWADMTPPEWKHLDDDAVEQLKARGVTRPWEKEYICKNGARVPILVGVAMLNEFECVAFVLDTSERKRLEELQHKSRELEAENRRIQEANRLKSEFLANMSHELRTPLNSIIGFGELLHDGEIGYESPQYREFLGDILKNGRHLLQLINDVLDLAKVESGKMDFRPESVDLGQLIGDVAAVLRGIASSKQIHLEVDIDCRREEVTIDPARLKQILYNYVSNAVKFTANGGRIMLRARDEGSETFRLEVEDNGIGIEPADIRKLFVEFQQLDAGSTKKQGGTGLGLALTKRIVEAQGGSVGVRSVPGKGSVFFAMLPRHSAGMAEVLEPNAATEGADGRVAVLVVEDDVRDRALLLHTLHKAGYVVEAASTGRDAIASCRARKFDAITLDLLLPDTTGLEVLHRVRIEGKNQETPVIIVSVVAERGVVGGFSVHDYLQKPVNGVDVLASLGRAGVAPDKVGTILVVDDDTSALKLMCATLQQLGYATECALDGEGALDIAAKRRPIAVVLDLLMPGLDGFEFLLRFRLIPENGSIPVVVWTMKDLTAGDRARLHQLAQTIIAKGSTMPISDQLRALLPPPRASPRRNHERAASD